MDPVTTQILSGLGLLTLLTAALKVGLPFLVNLFYDVAELRWRRARQLYEKYPEARNAHQELVPEGDLT